MLECWIGEGVSLDVLIISQLVLSSTRTRVFIFAVGVWSR